MNLYFNSLMSIFYPQSCIICSGLLYKDEQIMCLSCALELPKVSIGDFTEETKNEIIHRLIGKLSVEKATTAYYFYKTGATQKLLHQIKYNGRKDIATYLATSMAQDLVNTDFFESIDCIVPIPLNSHRYAIRGYNQAFEIAKGIQEVVQLPIITKGITRPQNTVSQTQLDPEHRFSNVQNAFKIAASDELKNKHCLIVDDVFTTGSTISAFAHQLMSTNNCKVSIATIGIAPF